MAATASATVQANAASQVYSRQGTTLVPVQLGLRSEANVVTARLAMRVGTTINYLTAPLNAPPPPAPAPTSLDWRASPLLRPPAGQIVFGEAPVVGLVSDFEAIWKRPIRMQRVYSNAAAGLASLLGACQSLLNIGIVPVIDFNSPATYAQVGFPMTNVAGTGQTMWAAQGAGYFDASKTAATSFTGQAYMGFDEFLTGIKNLTAGACPSNRVILSKDHEMEAPNEGGGNGKVVGQANAVAAGTSAEFRVAWRHFKQRMVTVGVTNAQLLFNFASGTTTWGASLTDTGSTGFYPGHDCVDIVGWDPYNSAGVRDSTWREFSNMINKFGQLNWWNANFAVDGGTTLATTVNGRVYKPAMLAEFGTTDSLTTAAGVTFTAETWATNMQTYLSDPAVNAIFRWIIYFNNSINTILTNPSYRFTGFSNVGRGSLWSGIDPLLP